MMRKNFTAPDNIDDRSIIALNNRQNSYLLFETKIIEPPSLNAHHSICANNQVDICKLDKGPKVHQFLLVSVPDHFSPNEQAAMIPVSRGAILHVCAQVQELNSMMEDFRKQGLQIVICVH